MADALDNQVPVSAYYSISCGIFAHRGSLAFSSYPTTHSGCLLHICWVFFSSSTSTLLSDRLPARGGSAHSQGRRALFWIGATRYRSGSNRRGFATHYRLTFTRVMVPCRARAGTHTEKNSDLTTMPSRTRSASSTAAAKRTADEGAPAVIGCPSSYSTCACRFLGLTAVMVGGGRSASWCAVAAPAKSRSNVRYPMAI